MHRRRDPRRHRARSRPLRSPARGSGAGVRGYQPRPRRRSCQRRPCAARRALRARPSLRPTRLARRAAGRACPSSRSVRVPARWRRGLRRARAPPDRAGLRADSRSPRDAARVRAARGRLPRARAASRCGRSPVRARWGWPRAPRVGPRRAPRRHRTARASRCCVRVRAPRVPRHREMPTRVPSRRRARRAASSDPTPATLAARTSAVARGARRRPTSSEAAGSRARDHGGDAGEERRVAAARCRGQARAGRRGTRAACARALRRRQLLRMSADVSLRELLQTCERRAWQASDPKTPLDELADAMALEWAFRVDEARAALARARSSGLPAQFDVVAELVEVRLAVREASPSGLVQAIAHIATLREHAGDDLALRARVLHLAATAKLRAGQLDQAELALAEGRAAIEPGPAQIW